LQLRPLSYKRLTAFFEKLRTETTGVFSAVRGGGLQRILSETFEEHQILLKFKEGENFNHRNTLRYFEDSANASLRAKFEPDAEIG